MQTIQNISAILGAVYALVSIIGNAYPKGKVGAFCAKVALVLRKVQDATK